MTERGFRLIFVRVAAERYNPLDKINLGKSVAEALLDRDPAQLGDQEQFEGAAIYAIYYSKPTVCRFSRDNLSRMSLDKN